MTNEGGRPADQAGKRQQPVRDEGLGSLAHKFPEVRLNGTQSKICFHPNTFARGATVPCGGSAIRDTHGLQLQTYEQRAMAALRARE
jgi:hypothetical protein